MKLGRGVGGGRGRGGRVGERREKRGRRREGRGEMREMRFRSDWDELGPLLKNHVCGAMETRAGLCAIRVFLKNADRINGFFRFLWLPMVLYGWSLWGACRKGQDKTGTAKTLITNRKERKGLKP